tara:strand:- start:6380 stop:6910 length:531 start_codon:yes stop_codon:yes gene_type:complete
MTFDNELHVLDNKFSRWQLDHINDCALNAKYSYNQSTDSNSPERDCRFAALLDLDELGELHLDDIIIEALSDFKFKVNIQEAYFNHYPIHAYVNRHIDEINPACATVIVCCNKYWDESWGGELKIYENDGPIHKVIDYSPGRIIIFDSRLEHKVLPITPYARSDRFTLAFKTEIEL